MEIFQKYESDVRSYCRAFPEIFDHAKGSIIHTEDGDAYIDFLAGAGTLNYGHNPDCVREALIAYLEKDRIVHSLDKATLAKREFILAMQELILQPRGLDYKIQFVGPTGTNAVESALKLARQSKKLSNVIAFTNGYHGLTLGALAVTGNNFYRGEFYGHRLNTDTVPFCSYFDGLDSVAYLRRMLEGGSSGIDQPAAVIVETVQGEGGINVASVDWLRDLSQLCKEKEIILIVDDIQMGNGRTGSFFSFERAGIEPDIICLSKSLGGGLPMSVVLLRPGMDKWLPGEHTGTFRGNNLAFIAAAALIRKYWSDDELEKRTVANGQFIGESLSRWSAEIPGIKVRGLGMAWGIEFAKSEMAAAASQAAFRQKLIAETCGAESEVLKLLPSLTIERELLEEGLARLKSAILSVVKKSEERSHAGGNGEVAAKALAEAAAVGA
jgi:diaminobutyrate-2-oxoglutarate transaminase